ncbi:MAG TPA: outer membrane lipoprotein carrier protein LolA [bacterium]|nr:outer membrane lipoprotein carrier protein LolA [bacterium]
MKLPVATLLLVFCALAPAWAGGEELVRAMLAKQATYAAVQGDFVQERRMSAMDQTARAAGVISYARPNCMRWDYHEPMASNLISNGDTLWYYVPELQQAQVMNLGAHPSVQRLMIALSLGSPGAYEQLVKSFRIFAANRDGKLRITLKAKQADLYVKQINVAVNPATMLPERISITDRNNDVSVLQFSGFRFNPELATDAFSFVPSAGVEVIPLDMLGVW